MNKKIKKRKIVRLRETFNVEEGSVLDLMDGLH